MLGLASPSSAASRSPDGLTNPTPAGQPRPGSPLSPGSANPYRDPTILIPACRSLSSLTVIIRICRSLAEASWPRRAFPILARVGQSSPGSANPYPDISDPTRGFPIHASVRQSLRGFVNHYNGSQIPDRVRQSSPGIAKSRCGLSLPDRSSGFAGPTGPGDVPACMNCLAYAGNPSRAGSP